VSGLYTTADKRVPSASWEQSLDSGIHVCQLFADEEDRLESMIRYLASGIEAGQKCGCWTFDDAQSLLAAEGFETGLSMDDARARGQLSFEDADRVWFADGKFDPERLLSQLSNFHDSTGGEAWKGSRIVAEISPAIPEMPGGGRLIEYEVEVNRFLRGRPMTVICQYDLRRFSGSVLLDVLHVHPYVMIRGSIMPNPFYSLAEDALAAA
jgi:hypothetical protein